MAHHADFDAAFALNEFAKAGLQLPVRPWPCTMLLARHLFPEWRNHKLGTCLAEVGIPLGGEEHDAGAEAVACAALARYLIDVAKDAGVLSLHDLLGVAGVRPGVEDPEKWDGRQPRIEALPPNSRFYAHKRAHRDLEELEHGWPPLSQKVAAVEALRDAGCGNVNAIMDDLLSGRYETPEDGPWYVNPDDTELAVACRIPPRRMRQQGSSVDGSPEAVEGKHVHAVVERVGA